MQFSSMSIPLSIRIKLRNMKKLTTNKHLFNFTYKLSLKKTSSIFLLIFSYWKKLSKNTKELIILIKYDNKVKDKPKYWINIGLQLGERFVSWNRLIKYWNSLYFVKKSLFNSSSALVWDWWWVFFTSIFVNESHALSK